MLGGWREVVVGVAAEAVGAVEAVEAVEAVDAVVAAADAVVGVDARGVVVGDVEAVEPSGLAFPMILVLGWVTCGLEKRVRD